MSLKKLKPCSSLASWMQDGSRVVGWEWLSQLIGLEDTISRKAFEMSASCKGLPKTRAVGSQGTQSCGVAVMKITGTKPSS